MKASGFPTPEHNQNHHALNHQRKERSHPEVPKTKPRATSPFSAQVVCCLVLLILFRRKAAKENKKKAKPQRPLPPPPTQARAHAMWFFVEARVSRDGLFFRKSEAAAAPQRDGERGAAGAAGASGAPLSRGRPRPAASIAWRSAKAVRGSPGIPSWEWTPESQVNQLTKCR